MFGPNPKDGWKAFTVAVCASLVQATTFGISNSFPNFVFEMTQDPDLGNPSNSILSIVQAVALGMAAITSIPAGIVVDKFGPRAANSISCIGLVAALLLASLVAKSGEAMIGLYSIPMGVAMGFMMSTGATATSSWFDKKAAVGMGICFTGGGTGSLTVPRIAGALAASYSWRTSFLILTALAAIHLVSTCFVCIRPTDGDEEEEQELKVPTITTATNNASPTVAEENQSPAPTAAVTASVDAPPTLAAHTAVKKFNYHTDKATLKQLLFECVLTRNFLGLFFAYGFFSIGFYGFLYIAVPFPLSMGTAGGPYADATPISVDSASNVFVPFGITQTLGGPLNGALATRSDPRLIFIACQGLLAVTVAYCALCRKLWEFCLVCGILGYGISGFFATFGTMVAQRFWGPNLSWIMSLAFSGAVFGGFLGSTLSTEITNGQNGDYTYATVLYSLAFFFAGMCVMFVVQDVEDADAHLKSDTASAAEEKKPLLLSPDSLIAPHDADHNNTTGVASVTAAEAAALKGSIYRVQTFTADSPSSPATVRRGETTSQNAAAAPTPITSHVPGINVPHNAEGPADDCPSHRLDATATDLLSANELRSTDNNSKNDNGHNNQNANDHTNNSAFSPTQHADSTAAVGAVDIPKHTNHPNEQASSRPLSPHIREEASSPRLFSPVSEPVEAHPQ